MKKTIHIISGFILIILISCELDLVTPYNYEPSKPDRWDKTVNALTYIRTAKTRDRYTFTTLNKNKYLDSMLFATFDSLLKITNLEHLLSDPDYKTFFIPTNRAFYDFYIDKLNWKNGKQQYFKLADLPDSTKRNIVLLHIIPGHRLLADSIPVAEINKNYKSAKGVNVTIKRDDSFRVNMNYFPPVGSAASRRPRTSNLEPTNGVIHVMDRFYIWAEKDMHLGSFYVEPI